METQGRKKEGQIQQDQSLEGRTLQGLLGQFISRRELIIGAMKTGAALFLGGGAVGALERTALSEGSSLPGPDGRSVVLWGIGSNGNGEANTQRVFLKGGELDGEINGPEGLRGLQRSRRDMIVFTQQFQESLSGLGLGGDTERKATDGITQAIRVYINLYGFPDGRPIFVGVTSQLLWAGGVALDRSHALALFNLPMILDKAGNNANQFLDAIGFGAAYCAHLGSIKTILRAIPPISIKVNIGGVPSEIDVIGYSGMGLLLSYPNNIQEDFGAPQTFVAAYAANKVSAALGKKKPDYLGNSEAVMEQIFGGGLMQRIVSEHSRLSTPDIALQQRYGNRRPLSDLLRDYVERTKRVSQGPLV